MAERDLRALEAPGSKIPRTGNPKYRRLDYWRDLSLFIKMLMALDPKDPLRRRYLEAARDATRRFASYQADDPKIWATIFREASSGKIPHEIQRNFSGWLWVKAHGGIGFLRGHPYFGSVDATPLFVISTIEFALGTGADAFLRELTPNIMAAVEWIERELEAGGGFIRYAKQDPSNPKLHAHHGWKDGFGRKGLKLMHIQEPIALVEVQGYAYQALMLVADNADDLGLTSEHEQTLRAEARTLRSEIQRRFWIPEADYFAMAIDGHDRKTKAITSNPAHLVWFGVVEPDSRQGEAVAAKLADPEHLWTPYGIRTHSPHRYDGGRDPHFDWRSPHRGGVWPHESAVVHLGYGRREPFAPDASIPGALIHAVQETECIPEYYRVPEDGLSIRPGGNAQGQQLWSAMAVAVVARDAPPS